MVVYSILWCKGICLKMFQVKSLVAVIFLMIILPVFWLWLSAFRLGILHQPLTVPSISSIPKELWQAPSKGLSSPSNGGRSSSIFSVSSSNNPSGTKRSHSVDVIRYNSNTRQGGGVIYNLLAKCHIPHSNRRGGEEKNSTFANDNSIGFFSGAHSVIANVDDSSDYSSGEDDVSYQFVNDSAHKHTRKEEGAGCEGSDNNSTSYFAKYQNNSLGNSRQELAQLYKETLCQPYPSESAVEATAELIGRRQKSKGIKKKTVPKKIFPKELPPHVLKPGMYKAKYGGHGYEIVLLEYRIREIALIKVSNCYYLLYIYNCYYIILLLFSASLIKSRNWG